MGSTSAADASPGAPSPQHAPTGLPGPLSTDAWQAPHGGARAPSVEACSTRPATDARVPPMMLPVAGWRRWAAVSLVSSSLSTSAALIPGLVRHRPQFPLARTAGAGTTPPVQPVQGPGWQTPHRVGGMRLVRVVVRSRRVTSRTSSTTDWVAAGPAGAATTQTIRWVATNLTGSDSGWVPAWSTACPYR